MASRKSGNSFNSKNCICTTWNPAVANISTGRKDSCIYHSKQTNKPRVYFRNMEENNVLSLEHRGEIQNKARKSRKVYIRCLVVTMVLLILAGVLAYVIVYGMNRQKTSVNKCSDCFGKALASVKSSEIILENPKYNDNRLKKSFESNGDRTDTCMTPSCQSIADDMKKSMNTSVNPCEDFYEYVCGRWHEHNTLPESMPKIDVLSSLGISKELLLKKIIEQKTPENKKLNGFKNKITKFYQSCLNLEEIDKEGKRPLLRLISMFGKWTPIKKRSYSTRKTDIADAIILSHQFFTSSVYNDFFPAPLFKSGVKVNDYDSRKHSLVITPPNLPLQNLLTYTNETSFEKIQQKYRLLMTNYVALLGPAKTAKQKLTQLMEFEAKLAKIILNSTYTINHLSIAKLMNLVGNEIDWLKVIKGFYLSLPRIKINEEIVVEVHSIDFFKNLNNLIQVTPKQLVRDYIIWICVWKFGSYASAPFRDANHNFQNALLGINARPETWTRCIQDLEETMEFGLTSLFVKHTLTDSDKLRVTDIVKKIQKEFMLNLVNVDWMDVRTKAEAFEKVKSMNQGIGYPNFVTNETHLDVMYKKVKIIENKYFGNILSMYKMKRLQNLQWLDKEVDLTFYALPPTLHEAYFDHQRNSIVILAGILKPPIYDPKRSEALNFGGLGMVIGHEISHSFDSIGRNYDSKGEKRDWWSDESSKSFLEKADCIKEQFSNFSVYGINIDGEGTLSENMGDTTGIKIAFMTYKEWKRDNPSKDEKLPGLPLNADQLFFVAHGQILCGVYREEYMKNFISQMSHSPARYRVNGPLSNLPEFSKVYNCPIGSPMNPGKKCSIF